MSDTPETQEAVERWRQGKINIFDEMARLERERDEARRGIRLMAQNAEVWKEKADQARRELDIQLESIHFHMERVPVKDHPLRAGDAPLGGEEHEKSDTPETRKVFDWFYSRNADRVSSFIGINRVQVRMEDLERERDEAREALRVLFDDYKQLADSGDAGFWELEDKEAAQPALRILQQMEDTNPITKPEQVSSKLARYKKDAEVVTEQRAFRRLVEAIVTTDMTANTLLEVRRLFGDEIDAAVACLRRTEK